MILVIVHWKSNNTLMNNNKKLPAQAAPKNEPFFCFYNNFKSMNTNEEKTEGKKSIILK